MAHAAGDAHPFPIYGAHFRATFPIWDIADPTLLQSGAGTPDSERSIDGATFADCTNEATELTTNSGMYYLDLTGAEMTSKCTAAIVKSTDGVTTPIVLYPTRMPSILTGTAAGGAASTITLAASSFTSDQALNGCYVLITNNSPAGAQYQARKIISCVASTQVCTVESAWGTNPDNTSTYSVLVPSAVNIASVAGSTAAVVPQPSVTFACTSGTTTTAIKFTTADATPACVTTADEYADRFLIRDETGEIRTTTASSDTTGTSTLTVAAYSSTPDVGETFTLLGSSVAVR
jgi:hypothetical protein